MCTRACDWNEWCSQCYELYLSSEHGSTIQHTTAIYTAMVMVMNRRYILGLERAGKFTGLGKVLGRYWAGTCQVLASSSTYRCRYDRNSQELNFRTLKLKCLSLGMK